MAGKKKVEKQTASLVGGIGAQSRKIWLAGLGAYARSGNNGRDAFDTLVLEGKRVEEAQLPAAKQALAAKAPPSVSPKASAKASAASAKAKAKAKPVTPLTDALPKTKGAEALVEKAIALNAANAKPAKKAAKAKSAVDETGTGEKKTKARKAAAKP